MTKLNFPIPTPLISDAPPTATSPSATASYNFLLIFKQTLDDLLQTFQGLRVQRKIPCRCPMQAQTPHYHNYEDLERQLARGRSTLYCSESGIELPLAQLLYGIHISTMPQVTANIEYMLQTLLQRQMPADELRRRLEHIDQAQEYHYRTFINWARQSKHPRLFILTRTSRSPINPHDWLSRTYRLHLMCEYPQGPHTINGQAGYEIRQGKEWWNAISPWLRRIVKVLKIGLPLAKDIGDIFDPTDIDRFAQEIAIFNEILTDLPAITTTDAIKDAQLDPDLQTIHHPEGAASEALHTFLQTHPRPWQNLTPVTIDNGTTLWLCDHHRQQFEPPLITGI